MHSIPQTATGPVDGPIDQLLAGEVGNVYTGLF